MFLFSEGDIAADPTNAVVMQEFNFRLPQIQDVIESCDGPWKARYRIVEGLSFGPDLSSLIAIATFCHTLMKRKEVSYLTKLGN